MVQAANILIVDDHPLVREALALCIASQPRMKVCGKAADGAEALRLIRATNPDLAIVDLALHHGHGLDLIKQIRARQERVKILVLSGLEESLYAERSLRAGAQGYINKRECPENIVAAIGAVLAGKRWFSDQVTQRLLAQAAGSGGDQEAHPLASLSDRQLEVFRMIGHGMTTRAIANRLHLSIHTVESHRENIRRKLGLKNGAELMRRAVQWVLENP